MGEGRPRGCPPFFLSENLPVLGALVIGMRVVLRVKGNPWWVRQIDTANPNVDLTGAEKLRRLLNASLATPYFSRRQWADRLLEAQSLKDLPVMAAREVLDGRTQFLNPKAGRALGMLRLPFGTTGGVLMGRPLRLPEGVVAIDEGMFARLHLSETKLLAATPAVLRRICAAVEGRTLALPKLCEAVVVLQGVEEGFLFEGERNMLWRCLGVPVFEQWVGLDGELLAWECGSHQGLHFQGGRAELEEVGGELVVTSWFGLRTPVPRLGTGLIAEADPRVCPCGDERPLLRGLTARRRTAEPVRMAAMA